MNNNFEIAVYVMVIGMITVFTILLLVVLSSSLLIKLVNKYGPAPQIKQEKAKKFETKKLAVLAAVVEHLTNGTGKIKNVKKGN